MLCAISGVAPSEPVFSSKSGHVFEKRLIIKHLKATNTCPVTNEDLSEADIVPVRSNPNIAPRAPAGSSLPSMISTFQNEWDALMLESFTLKQHLETTQQELAHALYQHDAACRVIARLIKERDEARRQLGDTEANVAGAVAKGAAGAAASGAEQGIAGAPAKVMAATAKELSKGRRKKGKAAQAAVTAADKVAKYKNKSSHPLHSASKPGVLCLDLHPTNNDIAVTGGADGNAVVYNFASEKVVDTLKGHKKKVTDVQFHPSGKTLFTTSADNSAMIWNAAKDGSFSQAAALTNHKDAVVGCSVHPSGSYLVTASKDKTWNFYDIEQATCIQSVSDDKVSTGYTKVKFHPDGLILGLGTEDSLVRMFEVKSQKQVAQFTHKSGGAISALAFSENGYYLTSGDDKGVVKVWDLRHLDKELTTLEGKMKNIGDLSFDMSGTYLGVACDNARVYDTKSWEIVNQWSDHSSAVTGIRFGDKASFVATTSKDRSLKIFS